MFAPDDRVVHRNHGAGIVKGFRMLTRKGKKRKHFCIELTGNRGLVFIPVTNIDNVNIRLAMHDLTLIRKELRKTPEKLPDNHQTRRLQVKKLINSGSPQQVAQALRDLCWRERTEKLTQYDEKMRDEAIAQLAEEIAICGQEPLEAVRQRILELINNTMEHHLEHLKQASVV